MLTFNATHEKKIWLAICDTFLLLSRCLERNIVYRNIYLTDAGDKNDFHTIESRWSPERSSISIETVTSSSRMIKILTFFFRIFGKLYLDDFYKTLCMISSSIIL